MRNRVLSLLCLGLAASLATEAKANFVVNGNFATPTVGNFITFTSGSTGITGWKVIPGTNGDSTSSVDLLSTGFIAPESTAPIGSQTVDLDGTGGSTIVGGLQQAISGLTVGTTYTLSFFYTNNYNAASASAMVTIDGVSASITHSGSTQSLPAWTAATYTFVATGTDVLSFVSTDAAGSASGVILDNVSINPSVAVPEPASIAMVGLGLAGVAGLARARRRTA